MTDKRKIDEQFTVGLGHPSQHDLKQIADDGYKAVVNLRAAKEENQPLKPDEEGEAVRALGMEYRHIPVSPDARDFALVDKFRDSVKALPDPVYVHCASGKRSGAFTMMHVAAENGMSGKETLEKAESMGFACDSKDLENFVSGYVDREHG